MKKILIIFVLLSIAIQSSTAQTIITVVGTGTVGYSGDGGLATSATLNKPACVAFDAAGNVYISDTYNHVIRKVNTSGIISTYAGTGTFGYSGNGGPATSAKLFYPTGIAVDVTGNIYFAEAGNNVIRKVDTSGIISTIAGNHIAGYSGDGGPATSAKLFYPIGVAIDTTGNIYIADYYNNVIRKVNTSGIISTIAGNNVAGYSGDGGLATSAKLNEPFEIEIDVIGNIYFTELSNDVVRKVNTSGIISTFAGTGTAGYSGDGGPAASAQLWDPSGLAIDNIGNLYIAEGSNQDVRKVNTLGIISTIAGIYGIIGYSGDGGPAILAQFNGPQGIDFDAAGNLYIADCLNSVIREIGDCMPVTPVICMVSVDSLSQNNIIYWDKTPYTADTFYVYRDTSNNNFALIGKVSYDSLSIFIDTVRTLYAANGDPNASSWRYKIAYRDTCGGNNIMSSMSPYHQTMFLINSGSIFAWTQYQIEGQVQPVPALQNYLFERDNYSTGNYIIIQTLSASSTLYNDAQYATYQDTATWRVSTKWSISCDPAKAENHNSSRSNVRLPITSPESVRGLSPSCFAFQVIPNPNNGVFTLKTNCKNQLQSCEIRIFNLYGQEVFRETLIRNLPNEISISLKQPAGIYNVQISCGDILLNKKIIVH